MAPPNDSIRARATVFVVNVMELKEIQIRSLHFAQRRQFYLPVNVTTKVLTASSGDATYNLLTS